MTTLLDGLEWNWNGINSKKIEYFLNVINKIPLTISRAGTSKDPNINVWSYGPQAYNGFIISPKEGNLEYIFERFKGQGFFNSNFSIGYYPPLLSKELSKHNCLEVRDGEKAFYFLTEPL
ncbi:MAG: hypothetical protein ACP5NZ_03470 [Nanobdellota archaeon]